ncbi:MAG: hypothetical protein PHR35_15495 [Kiritimatiellae bacterium]|nr:hypothetical protein [Kiritimatiellia bacterium]
MLWVTAPTTLTYATFEQDTVYVVFFTLALWLSWLAASGAERPPVAVPLALGVVLATLVMLNFSWCVMTTIFAVFCLMTGSRRHWSRIDFGLRTVLPLAVMTLLAGALCWHYRLDYLAIYRVASDYVRQWYRFDGPHQWLQAFIGGQMDLWLMMGSVALSAFLAGERRLQRAGTFALPRLYLLAILGVFMLPLLFGPHPLKMETARCWNWMLPVPIAFAAFELSRHHAARLLLPGAVAVAGLTHLTMRLFLNFSP